MSIPPMAYSKVLTSIRNLYSGLGIASVRADVKDFFNFANALLSSLLHFQAFFPVSSVRGLASCANPLMNYW